jgi:hypothetical protein
MNSCGKEKPQQESGLLKMRVGQDIRYPFRVLARSPLFYSGVSAHARHWHRRQYGS